MSGEWCLISLQYLSRTRHDSEVQGRCEVPPRRGESTSNVSPAHGIGGGGFGWEGQVAGWRDNNQEMEDFEMEMDN